MGKAFQRFLDFINRRYFKLILRVTTILTIGLVISVTGTTFFKIQKQPPEKFLKIAELMFYGVVGIRHGGAYFHGFMAFEKQSYQARFKVVQASLIK